MGKKSLVWAGVVIALGMKTSARADQAEAEGLKVAQKLDQANEGFGGERAEVEMKLINAHGDVVIRKMKMLILERDDDGNRSLVEFSWPADVNGTKLLTWAHKTESDDQWLYLPAIKRIKRISARNKSGSFMGSEFSYEDLASQEVEKYRYRLLGTPELNGRKTWHMERFPVDKRSGYSRQVTWSDQEYMNPVKIEYYDRKNELLKVAEFTGYKKHGRFHRWAAIDMRNVQTKKRSILTWKTRELPVTLDEDDFESDALED